VCDVMLYVSRTMEFVSGRDGMGSIVFTTEYSCNNAVLTSVAYYNRVVRGEGMGLFVCAQPNKPSTTVSSLLAFEIFAVASHKCDGCSE